VNSERLYKRSRLLLRVGSREATLCLFVAPRQRTVEHRWEVIDQDLVVAFATTESKGGMNYQNSTTLCLL
jgi:hypothetical protein